MSDDVERLAKWLNETQARTMQEAARELLARGVTLPTPPPAREGAVTRWSHDYINGGDDLVEREDGAYVLYTDYAAAQAALAQALEERDSARHICNAVAETLGWAKTYDPSMLPSAVAHLKAQVAAGDAAQAEAERLRGEVQRLCGAVLPEGVDVVNRVMTRAIEARALPATPAPGPSAEDAR